MNGLLPLYEILQKLGFHITSKCAFCPAAETLQHVFLNCRLARQLWGQMADIFGLQLPIYGSLQDVLHDCWNLKGDWAELSKLFPAAVLWTLWRNRCAAVYDNKCLSGSALLG